MLGFRVQGSGFRVQGPVSNPVFSGHAVPTRKQHDTFAVEGAWKQELIQNLGSPMVPFLGFGV